jgi:hypothetical protein
VASVTLSVSVIENEILNGGKCAIVFWRSPV